MKPFCTNQPKDIIRAEFDKTLIRRLHQKKGHKLTYFGLPGPEMLDVIEWKEYIENVVAVERENLPGHLMKNRAFNAGFSSRNFQILRGDINDIIVKGQDADDRSFQFYPFDIVNLDFISGILHKDLKGRSKIVTSIRHLLQKHSESNQDLVLFLTFNSRNSDMGEFDKVLSAIQEALDSYKIQSSESIKWYLKQRVDYKIKAYVPYIFSNWCRTYGYTCSTIHAITYKGTGNVRMIHFGILLENQPDVAAGALKSQSLVEILNMPMYEVKDEKIEVSAEQAPQTSP